MTSLTRSSLRVPRSTEPVSKKDCPQYYAQVEHPIDLEAMRKKSIAGRYDAEDGASQELWDGENSRALSTI